MKGKLKLLISKEVKKPGYKLFGDHREKIRDGLGELKVIYTDLDGTLYNDRGCIIKDREGKYYFKAVRLLEDIEKKGLKIVIVSGRDKYQLKYHSQVIGISDYIAELGAEAVYNDGKDVHITFDNGRHIHDLTYGSRELEKIIDLMNKNFPGKIESRMEWSRYRSFNAVFFGEIDLDYGNEILKKAGYDGLEFVDNGISRLVKLDLDVEKLHIYNLMPEGVNKASGVRFDRESRGLEIENCIALGDSPEDLKMAGEVKYFFLMKNALEQREAIEKELASHDNVYLTGEIMNKGWYEVMSFLLG
ncbi:MAG: HAD family phosphatase [Actinobacteria bacterium]|nr:HAD family phosphatase [Actinomycetota bacterium]